MRRVTQITNRRAKTHRYAYDTRVEQGAHYEIATVTDARSRATDAPPMDARHRPIEVVDPLGTKTLLAWDADNNVVRHTRAAGTADEAVKEMAYNANGMLTEHRENRRGAKPDGNVTTLRYQDSAGTMLTELGTARGQGVRLRPALLQAAQGQRVGVPARRQGERAVSRSTRCATWPRRSTARSAWSRRSTTSCASAPSFATTIPTGCRGCGSTPRTYEAGADPVAHRWIYKYDALGNLKAATDPRGARTGGVDDPRTLFTATFDYDAFDRLVTSRVPVDSAAGRFIHPHPAV